jgi:hypothetical protein
MPAKPLPAQVNRPKRTCPAIRLSFIRSFVRELARESLCFEVDAPRRVALSWTGNAYVVGLRT